MVSVTITEKGGKPTVRDFDQPEINIGRVQGNDIVLPKSNISKRHARLVKGAQGYVVIDAKSTNGTYVNGKRLTAPHDLRPGDKVFVGDFTLEVRPAPEAARPAERPGADRRQQKTRELSQDAELESDAAADWPSPQQPDWSGEWNEAGGAAAEEAPVAPRNKRQAPEQPTNEPEEAYEEPLEEGPEDEAQPDYEEEEAEPEEDGEAEPEEAEEEAEPEPPVARRQAPRAAARRPIEDEPSQALRAVHERLARSVDMRKSAKRDIDDPEKHAQTTQAVKHIVQSMQNTGELKGSVQAESLVNQALDEAIGLGPLQPLLDDPTVSEILVNNARQVFVERDGRLELTEVVFSSDQAVLNLIEQIVAPLGRRVDSQTPMMDARLPDGSRVNAVIPPLAIRGPTLTIRKFTSEPLQIDDLVAGGSLNADMAEFFEVCVQARKNIIISGGTGSGKTTLLNVVSSFIDLSERIITIEDAAELKLDQDHVVALESRPPDANGENAIGIRELVRNALRMRPDRIVVGECRGGEALDMLQAMNTGHDGSLTTVHANSPRDALSRLETMVLMSGVELPIKAIREQVANAVDVIVQQARFSDGTRRITHITEIVGMEGEVVSMHDLFVYDQRGTGHDGRVQGRFRATGVVPNFYESLRARGMNMNFAIFRNT